MMNISERRKIVEMENAINTRDDQISQLNTLLDNYERKFGTIISKSITQDRQPSLKELLLEKVIKSDAFESFCNRLTCQSDIDDVKMKFSFSRKSPYRTVMHDEDGTGRKKILKIPYSEQTVSDNRREEAKHGEFKSGKHVDGKRYFTFEEA